MTRKRPATATRRRLPAVGRVLEEGLGRYGVTVAVALACFGLAFNGGSFGATVRGEIAIVVWWGLALTVALSLLPLRRPPRAALGAGGLLAAYVLLMALSVTWSDSAETAFDEFNRGALYVGVFALAVLAGTRENLRQWTTGLAIGMTGVVLVGLAARLFPHLAADPGHSALFRGDPRAIYPLGYWNGLGVFAGLTVPLLLRLALVARPRTGRALAAAALPAVASLIYLTASRGGTIVAVGAGLIFVVVTSERLRATLAGVVGVVGSAGALAVLHARPELVDGPLDTSTAAAQGRSAAVLIALACVATGGVWLLVSRLQLPAVRLSRRGKWAIAGVALALAAAGTVAADPGARLADFKHAPKPFNVESTGSGGSSSESNKAFSDSYTSSHFTSGGSSGRWQFWEAAVDEFRANPIAGGGAGSFGAWWAQHGSLKDPVRDAHSIYVESLAELGLVGFALLLALVGFAAASAAKRLRRTSGDERVTVAALTGVVAGFAIGAGLDWMWELPAVAAVGVLALGLLLGPATAGPAAQVRSRRAVRAAFVALAVILLAAEGSALLAKTDIQNSRAAASRGDDSAALEKARAARRWQPWASSAYLQIALVQEQGLSFDSARSSIQQAIDRDRTNWRLWFVASRIEREAGHPAAARADLARAKQLNPRSSLFSG